MQLLADFHFSITDIHTVTFPLPSDYLTSDRKRRFFVSVTDGRITRDTGSVLLNQQALHWSEILDGFIVDSSSSVTLKVFEKHDIRKNNLLATFLIPYEVLCSSRNVMVQCVNDSKKEKTPSREISVTWSEFHFDSDNVEETHSRLQTVNAEALKMNNSGLAVEVFCVSDITGKFLNTGKAIPSMQDFLAKCKFVSDKLELVVRAVDAITEVHPYAKIAWSVISFIPRKISEQLQLDNNVMDLLDALLLALDLGPDADELAMRCKRSKNHEKTFVRLLEQVNECGHFIQSYVMNDSFWKRLVKNVLRDGTTIVDNYRQTLEKLRDDFLREVIVTVEINVFRILAGVKSLGKNINEVNERVKEIDHKMNVRELLYGEGTEYDQNKRCLPQTRLRFLDAIIQWINDPDLSSPKVLALFGQAGTGKSSIANEVAHRYSRINRLTTSYFFVRGNPSGREPYRFFTTLARDLCRICPAFKATLGTIIDEKPELAHVRNYTMLVESLLLAPVKDLHFVGPIVVVIDALDENEDATHKRLYAGGNSIPFHTALLQCVSELPSNFRILITSRPEIDLLNAFPESFSVRHMRMDDQRLAKDVDKDIFIYVDAELRNAGVGEGDLQEMVKKAEGLFQWAAVACDFIAYPPHGLNSKLCLQRVLDPPTSTKRGLNPLDALYKTILERFDMDDPEVYDNFQTSMRQILGSFEPLSVDTLNTMRRSYTPADKLSDISDIVKGLGSLLSNVTAPDSALPVAPLHTSFRDFLTNKSQSGDFYVNLDNVHVEFASATLQTMQAQLRFNICKLETYLSSEVPDLQKRIDNNIPSLSYSCRFGADHLADVAESKLQFNLETSHCQSTDVPGLPTHVEKAILPRIGIEPKLNQHAIDLDERIKESIPEELRYACKFWAMHLCRSPVEDSRLYDMVHKFAYDHLIHWLEALSLMCMVDGGISSLELAESWIMLSPRRHTADNLQTLVRDGQRFIREFRKPLVASSDQIYVSALPLCPTETHFAKTFSSRYTGMKVLTGAKASWSPCIATLEGHTAAVGALVCSSDGNHLASRAGDFTIRTWNWRTAAATGMYHHQSSLVTCIAYCEDGRHVIMGSRNHVHIWDTQTGSQVGTPLHSFGVALAVSSHPQNQVILLSKHTTHDDIDEWYERAYCFDIQYAQLSLERHQLPENSAYRLHLQMQDREQSAHTATALSPVGNSCVIAGGDFNLRLWDTQTGARIGPVFEGHTDRILDVAFSHDGTQLVSTSLDQSIRLWDITSETAAVIIPNFSWRVVFSNDGNFVASGADDWTVRVWDVNSGDMVGLPLTGHIGRITSVTFSPDDRIVISGSSDGNVRIWDWHHGPNLVTEKVMSNRTSGIVYVRFSTNGRRALSVSRAQRICVWDTVTGATILAPLSVSGPEGLRVSSVKFSDDERHLIAIVTNEMHVWDIDSRNFVGTISLHGSGRLVSFALSPSSNIVATYHIGDLHIGDPQIYIQDWRSGSTSVIDIPTTNQRKLGHLSLAFTSDEELIVSSVANGMVEILDLTQLAVSGMKATNPHSMTPSDLSRTIVSTLSDGYSVDPDLINKESFWALPTHRIITAMQGSAYLHMVDGWIRGPEGVDLFWLPVEHRDRDCMRIHSIPYAVSASGNQILLGGQRLTFLDFSDMSNRQSRPLFHFFNHIPVVGQIYIY